MTPVDERLLFLSACIAETRRLTGFNSAICRSFVTECEDTLFDADLEQQDAGLAVRVTGLVICVEQADDTLEAVPARRASQTALVARKITVQVAAGDDADRPTLRRFAARTIEKARASAAAMLAA